MLNYKFKNSKKQTLILNINKPKSNQIQYVINKTLFKIRTNKTSWRRRIWQSLPSTM